MTPKAVKALEDSDIIVGYNTYIALVRDLIGDKEVVGNGMRQEVDRCQKAVDLAVEGHKVAVISSGDPGVYGMAGLVLELVEKVDGDKRPSCEIIPGLTAANTAAAALGAPLMHESPPGSRRGLCHCHLQPQEPWPCHLSGPDP